MNDAGPNPSPEIQVENHESPVDSAAPDTAAVAEQAAPAAAAETARPGVPHRESEWLPSLQSLASTVVIAVFVITFLVQAFQIPSPSMEDTLLIGDYLLVDKVQFAQGGLWSWLLPYRPIQRGDIIVFRYPVHPEQHFVKRVIAVPGDRVRLIDKKVYVNDQPVDEPYTVYKRGDVDIFRDDFPQPQLPSPYLDAHWWVELRKHVKGNELIVPDNSYFAMGDNREISLDSRYWGFVPRENIIGRPLVIYLSLRTSDADDAPPADDKLSMGGVLGKIIHMPRWRRAFRVVR
jgi:signal peptidase I